MPFGTRYILYFQNGTSVKIGRAQLDNSCHNIRAKTLGWIIHSNTIARAVWTLSKYFETVVWTRWMSERPILHYYMGAAGARLPKGIILHIFKHLNTRTSKTCRFLGLMACELYIHSSVYVSMFIASHAFNLLILTRPVLKRSKGICHDTHALHMLLV